MCAFKCYVHVCKCFTDKTIQLDSSVAWMKANAGQTGLYRVNYDLPSWVQFISMLQNEHTVSFLWFCRYIPIQIEI